THTHLDHVAALPVYVARRRMMRMEPPTIYLPADAVEGVEALLRAFQRLDRGRLPVRLGGLDAHHQVQLSRQLAAPAVPPPPPGTPSPPSASSSTSAGGSSSRSATT